MQEILRQNYDELPVGRFSGRESLVPIPSSLSTVIGDRVLAAWQDIGLGEMFLHLECVFDERLDEDRLARACELALNAEPVLGCRFAVDGAWPRWERIEGGSRPAPLERVADRAAYDSFLTEVLDQHAAPQARFALWRAPDGDRLALKISHAVADAGGAKDTMRVVADAYRRLESDASYVPAPNLSGSRSIAQVFRALPLRAHPSVVANTMRMLRRSKAPTRRIRPDEEPRHPFGWVVRHVDAQRTAALAAYGKERGATLNDLFVAAGLRAIAAGTDDVPGSHHRIQITVDLRRYLPSGRAGGISNLSAFEVFDIGAELGGSFDETLAKVGDVVSARKRNWLGLLDITLGPLLAAMSYRRLVGLFRARLSGGVFANALTNMGVIAEDDVNFGVKPRTAHLLTPVFYPPLFGAGLTGYSGSITFSVGAPEAVHPRAERFLDRLISELPVSR